MKNIIANRCGGRTVYLDQEPESEHYIYSGNGMDIVAAQTMHNMTLVVTGNDSVVDINVDHCTVVVLAHNILSIQIAGDNNRIHIVAEAKYGESVSILGSNNEISLELNDRDIYIHGSKNTVTGKLKNTKLHATGCDNNIELTLAGDELFSIGSNNLLDITTEEISILYMVSPALTECNVCGDIHIRCSGDANFNLRHNNIDKPACFCASSIAGNGEYWYIPQKQEPTVGLNLEG